ncbi:MAG: DNA repair protein RecO [Bauldia sp.]
MDWSDQGIVIGTRRHGETSLIVEAMTSAHGRHLGLVRGGRSRVQRSTLQVGNTVAVTWRARLEEHLGQWVVEPVTDRAARLMETGSGIYGIQLIAALLRLLPERDPHPALYATLPAILDNLHDPLTAGEVLVRFELLMLSELGFGLDLSRCAATGREDQDLAYVSPKTGRAVGRTAGEPYAGRLLTLPSLLLESRRNGPADADALRQAFSLTGFFLQRHVYEPRGEAMPPARESFVALLGRRN